MALFDRSALNPGVSPREVGAWALYDFANSGYTTVVLTAVFNAYFVGVVAQKADWATLAWTVALAVSNVAVMLTMPAIGAWADLHAAKKRLILAATVGCVASTAALAWAGRGDVAFAMAAVAVSNYCFAVGEALAGAFLPELARPERMGQVSGWAWSFGYFGGMLALGLSLAWVLSAQGRGETAERFVPVTMWIVAGVFAAAALPVFAILRERSPPGAAAAPADASLGGALRRVGGTMRAARAFPDFRRLMLCGAAYQAGISVVIALAAVYAEEAMGFGQTQTMMLVFLVNIASAVGAFAFGYAQDRVGHKRALAITLLGWIAMVLIAALTRSVAMFWLAAALAGLCMGSSQSCGRALVGYMTPAAHLAEFFGLWALATRLSAVVGPLVYGLVTLATAGDHRLAILVTGGFFVLGLALLHPIDVERGRAAAGRHDAGAAAAAAGRVVPTP
ncbi:MAG TPA: MFS transporter [Burkholderiaceae bacterium]|nr:MFS transporter [Burkholderiaceae bacterium]